VLVSKFSLSAPRITSTGALTASNKGHIPGDEPEVLEVGATACDGPRGDKPDLVERIVLNDIGPEINLPEPKETAEAINLLEQQFSFVNSTYSASLSTVISVAVGSIPSKIHAVETPVPVPSSRSWPPGLRCRYGAQKAACSGLGFIAKARARESRSIARRTLGVLQITESSRVEWVDIAE
jgi:hypothetical protein